MVIAHATDLHDALRRLQGGARLLAGGSWLWTRPAQEPDQEYVTLARIAGLDRLHAHPRTGLEIGASLPAARLLPDIWTGKRFAAIHEAVEQLDAPHVANLGTVVGNVCARDIDHDMAVALIALSADVELFTMDGLRRHSLAAWLAEKPGPAIVTRIVCPGPGTDAGSAFRKLSRSALHAGDGHRITAAATVGYAAERERITGASLVLGGVLPVPRRFDAVTAGLVGALPDIALFARAAADALATLEPADAPALQDSAIRAQAAVLLRDSLAQANSRALARHDHFDDAAEIAEEAL